MMKTIKVEQSWVITGIHTSRLWLGHTNYETSGSPAEVDFDANWTLCREEAQSDVLGMLHTHPGMGAYISNRDHATMCAWASCFGKPLLCLIYGNNGLHGWVYRDTTIGTDVNKLRFVRWIGNNIVGVEL